MLLTVEVYKCPLVVYTLQKNESSSLSRNVWKHSEEAPRLRRTSTEVK
jgi:hypothetical protein